MSDNKKANQTFVEWYATQLEGYLATEGHNPEQVLKYILSKLEHQSRCDLENQSAQKKDN